MDTQQISQNEAHYEPTVEQAQRASELRKFNLLFVYVPIGLISAIVVAIVVVLLIVAVNPPSEQALMFISGLADVSMVIAMLPIIIIGAVILGLIGYGYAQGRQAGMAPIRQTQRLLWRIDNLVGRLRIQTDETTAMIRQPFMAVNGAVTYVRVLIAQLVRMVKRS